MRIFDLQKLMDQLYDNLDYYASIEPENLNYEEDYHHITIDPDGKRRYLLEEREHSLNSINEITSYLDLCSPCKILDIGCGPGWLLSYLDENWQKHGVEISKFASNNASKYGEIFNGEFEEYDGKNFDIIVMNHVVEHFKDPIIALKKVKSLLNEDGRFIIGTPDFDSGAARRYGYNFRLLHDPTHVSLFSSDSMHRCLRDLGFHIEKVEYPFFNTDWFTKENLLKLFDENTISPPFYGSAMTFFCTLKK
tara:strand:- start:203 stop:952 length:750 start_codon:yes stop_codon:yes gene_type:complete